MHGVPEELRKEGREGEWVGGINRLKKLKREGNLSPYLLCLDRQALHKGVVDAVAMLCALCRDEEVGRT